MLYVYTYKKVCVHVYILLRNEQLFLFIINMQSKCEEYFPLKVGELKIFGPFRITTVSMTYQVEYEIRTIEIILVSVYILYYIRILYILICVYVICGWLDMI